jgi:hypothetical protein
MREFQYCIFWRILYFPEAVHNEYNCITDLFHAATSLKVQFPRKSYIEFWAGHYRGVPSPQQGSFEHPASFATSYLCVAGFSEVAATRTKYPSVMNLENDLRRVISKFQPRYDKLCSKRQPHPSHESRYETCILFISFKLKALNNV